MIPSSQQASQSYERRSYEEFLDERRQIRLKELGNLELNR